jgi:hypothetical protein
VSNANVEEIGYACCLIPFTLNANKMLFKKEMPMYKIRKQPFNLISQRHFWGGTVNCLISIPLE